MTTLTRKVARGAVWTYGSSFLVLVAQIVYTGMTSRLVAPSAFGAYATAQALTSLVSYFTLGSLGSAVTRAPELDAGHRWSALLLAAIGGVVGASGLWVLAPTWAALWSSPSSVPVVRALVLTTSLSPAMAVLVGLLRRQLRLRRAALVESLGAVVGMASGLFLVLRWHNAEALAVGLGLGTLTTVGLALASRLRLGAVSIRRDALRSLFSFASQVSVQNFVYFAVNTAPTWWVSRSTGAASLGQYSRASLIIGLPLTQLAAGSSKTLYPAYAHVQNDRVRMRGAITDALVAVSGVAAVLFAALAGSAPVVVPLLLGPHWQQATTLVPAFALMAAMNIVFVVLASAFEALAMLRTAWRVQGVLVASLALLLFAAAVLKAPLSMVAASLAVAYAAAHCYQLSQANRSGLVELPRLLAAHAIHAVIGCALGGGLWLVSSATTPAGLGLATAATAATGALSLAILWTLRRRIPFYRCLETRGLVSRSSRTPESELAGLS